MKWKVCREDWEVLVQFFPDGWEDQAKQMGALRRQRKIKTAGDLLRLLLIHLADGCSMRETVVRGKQGGLPTVSDVALLKRLRVSSEWFRWIAVELLRRRGVNTIVPEWLSSYEVRSVDASVITEPGSTGTDWRLHYSLKLFGLNCDQFLITRPDVGESFLNFKINKGDLLIGDRAYGRLRGLKYVKKRGGYFLVRLKNKAFKLYGKDNREFNLLEGLKGLATGGVGDWEINAATQKASKLAMRICAIKKSDEVAEKSLKRVLKEQKKKQRKIDPETLELHRYVILATSLPDSINARLIMELYRTRWQIEIAFKRLKSIMGLGHLPKFDEESSRAWLHGKLFVALLAQAIVDEGRLFSPWGYPMRESHM